MKTNKAITKCVFAVMMLASLGLNALHLQADSNTSAPKQAHQN